MAVIFGFCQKLIMCFSFHMYKSTAYTFVVYFGTKVSRRVYLTFTTAQTRVTIPIFKNSISMAEGDLVLVPRKNPKVGGSGGNDASFRKFIAGLMKRGKMKDSSIEELLTPETMKEFRVAFTHPSAGAERDYQLYEFLGDVVINEFVPFYLRWRFPKIISVKWITRLKHTLISKKYLAKLAREEGIDSHAIYGDEPFSDSEGRSLIGMRKEIEANPDLNTNMHYLNMLEDIMEGFFGCLVTVITDPDKGGKAHGVAVEISHNILKSFFGPVEITQNYEDVFDAVTRLKEMYESRARGYKWPTKEAFKYEKLESTDARGAPTVKFRAIVYGWPQGKKNVVPENRVELAREVAINKDDAKQKAAMKALHVLDSTWGIKETPLNPFEK